MLQDIEAFAPVLSALALLAAATAAWATLLFFNRRTFEATWLENLRKLNAEFWNDNQMAEVRKWLASEEDYSHLERVLKSRLSTKANTLPSVDNDVLEKIDRFCALMFRIGYCGRRSRNWEQQQLYHITLVHWILKMESRELLFEYVRVFWNPLHSLVEQEQKLAAGRQLWFRSQRS